MKQRSANGTTSSMLWRQCIRHAASVPLLLLTMAVFGNSVSRAEPPSWPVEMRVGRFRVHSDFKPQQGGALLRELRAITIDIDAMLAIPKRSDPIHVVLFETQQEYQRYMEVYFPTLPKRRAIFLQDRGPGMLFTHWHEDVATDLRHEITHAVLNSGQRSLPLWLDEGLAEYFETESKRRANEGAFLDSAHRHARQRGVQSISALSEITELSQFSETHYRDSWAWVHFMVHRNAQTRQLLSRYLNEYASGGRIHTDQPAQEPFDLERALREIAPLLEDELADHFRSLAAPSSKEALAGNTFGLE